MSQENPQNLSDWKLLTTPPSQSGRYIVAHRGSAKVIWYLHPGGDWRPNTSLGWQSDPREFGATHYMPLSEITILMSEAADIDFKTRGMTRIDSIKKVNPNNTKRDTPVSYLRYLFNKYQVFG